MIDYEDMRQAHLELVELRELLTKRLSEVDDNVQKPA